MLIYGIPLLLKSKSLGFLDVHPKLTICALEFCSHQVINKELEISHQQKMDIKPSLRLDAEKFPI